MDTPLADDFTKSAITTEVVVQSSLDNQSMTDSYSGSDIPEEEPNIPLKNICIPLPEMHVGENHPPLINQPDLPVEPITPLESKDFATPSQNLEQFSTPESMDLSSPEITIDDSKSRVAVSVLLKKSKRIYGAIRFYLASPINTNKNRFKSFMSSLQDTVKNTLASTLPCSKNIISQITSSLVNTLKGKRLPQYLKFLKMSLTSNSKRKKIKMGHERNAALPLLSNSIQQFSNGTVLNLIKKPELPQFSGFQFAKPKVYECGYCDTKFFKLPIYLKHLRRHSDLIKCSSCNRAFASAANRKRHLVQCRKRFLK